MTSDTKEIVVCCSGSVVLNARFEAIEPKLMAAIKSKYSFAQWFVSLKDVLLQIKSQKQTSSEESLQYVQTCKCPPFICIKKSLFLRKDSLLDYAFISSLFNWAVLLCSNCDRSSIIELFLT